MAITYSEKQFSLDSSIIKFGDFNASEETS